MIFLLLLLFLPFHLHGHYYAHVGPEVYYFQRDKAGGTHQNGHMEGVRVTLERLAPYSLYLGIDAFYAQGTLKGQSASGRPLKSYVDDFIYEGRIGYTLQNVRSFITPYGGLGHFEEKNAFRPPSRLTCTFRDSFNYTLIGFLTGFNLHRLLNVGVNFETKFMIDGRSRVTDDPVFDDVTLIMNDELQARVELPLTYYFSKRFDAQIVPFYEFRHFGGREDFPFDFIDTKFHLIGLRIAIGGSF